jgi:hypothetical protein
MACGESSPPTAADESAALSDESSAISAELASARQVRLRDDCDRRTFNDVLGDGACVGDGNTTFQEFIDELTEKGEVGAWKNDPHDLGAKPRERIQVLNEGGEEHTFTRVAAFGGGIVPLLNELSGNDEVAPECLTLAPEDFVEAGARFVIAGGTLPRGLTRFQCCIHPWMRTRVEVRP